MKIAPEYNQHGLNIHGLRHLCVVDHLDNNLGDYAGAAAKVNDTVQIVMNAYADKDRNKILKRMVENAECAA